MGGRVEGKVALVTGAAKGLGEAYVRGLLKEGAHVALCDVDAEAGRALAFELSNQGANAIFIDLDVTDETQWRSAVDATLGRFSRLDVLVNNAGLVLARVPIEQRLVEDWDRLMAVNVRGSFLGIKYAIPAMRTNGGGSIINISSIAGIAQSQLQEAAYATSKGAIRLLSKVIGTQYAHENIRCNSLHPGPIDGGMLRHSFAPDPESLARRLTRVPMGRLGRLEEVVAGVVFLASDESSFMTGAELVIDGGAVSQ